MFLVERELRRLLKKAYKGGLIVANHEGRIYLAGWGWEMDIKREHLPKEILAQIIELTGELPEPEKRFSATKDGNQFEIGDMEVKCEKMGTMLDISKLVLIPEMGSPMRVLKSIDFGKVILLHETVMQMVRKNCIDSAKGELPPSGPMYIPGEGIFWWNNIMRFKAMYMTPDIAEDDLIAQLEKIPF